jgi:4-carboxymuconolactone decarboxylase
MPVGSFKERFERGKALYQELFGIDSGPFGDVCSAVPGESGANDVVFANVFGDVWCRSQLTLKQRSLTTVSVLIALGKEQEMALHFGGLLNQGYHPEQLEEMCLHLGHYAGWPNCLAGRRALALALADDQNQVIVQRARQQRIPERTDAPYQCSAESPSERFQRGKLLMKTLTGRESYMNVVPDGGFLDVTFGNLFGDVWCRARLSIFERSSIVNAALMALGKEEELKSPHMHGFLHSGGTREQLEEMALHIAVYAGWPASIGASRALSAVAPASGH